MARRLNTRQIEQTASAIQATKIVQRLQAHVLDDLELTQSQVNAARILLNKVLPDQRDMNLDVDGELTIKVMSYDGSDDT